MPNSFTVGLRICAALCLLLVGGESALSQCTGDDLFASNRPGTDLRRHATAMPNREGRFWKISRGNSAPSYLFGTLHLSDPRLLPLPGTVSEAIRRASVLAIETTEVGSLGLNRPNSRVRNAFRDSIQAPSSRRAGKLLDPTEYEALKRLAQERRLPPGAIRAWKAAALALLLDLPPCASGGTEKRPYLDAVVAQIARDSGVEIIGLETLVEQFGVFDDLLPETERALLISVLRQAPHGGSAIESQIGRFLARDAGGIVALMQLGPTPEQPESLTPPEFLERLLAVRTTRMATRIEPLLERGNAFVAIGIAHLPGTEGLVAQLQRTGYTVAPVD